MNQIKIAALFPGQGAFYRSALKENRALYPAIDEALSEVDAAGRTFIHRSISDILFGPEPSGWEEMLGSSPELLQVGIYAVSVAIYRVLQTNGLNPDVLIGHSFGEIAALVCGGVYSVSQGTEIVLHRSAALKALQSTGGYMAALSVDRSRAEKLLAMAGGVETAIASENHKGQTVISGPEADMDRCAEIAAILKISFAKLKSPYPFHSPAMKPACHAFADRIRSIATKPSATPIFSPILNRYYTASDVLADRLAEHLVLPVNFASAMEKMYGEGVRTFVECGALNALTKITAAALEKPDVTAVACLDSSGEVASLRRAFETLGGQGLLTQPPIASPHTRSLSIANRCALQMTPSQRSQTLRTNSKNPAMRSPKQGAVYTGSLSSIATACVNQGVVGKSEMAPTRFRTPRTHYFSDSQIVRKASDLASADSVGLSEAE